MLPPGIEKTCNKADKFCTAQRQIDNRVVLAKVTAFVIARVRLGISHEGKE